MSDSAKQRVEAIIPTQKKAYKTPEVVTYGTVADLTETSLAVGLVFDGIQGPNKAS
ncbi:hypothetical protein BH10PLA2_BH10PLA2_37560 [soil metagenome]